MTAAASSACPGCGGPVPQTGRGRPRRYCSARCRSAASSRRHRERSVRIPATEEITAWLSARSWPG